MDGYHGPLPPDLVNHYAGWQGDVTVRTPQISAQGLAAYLESVCCHGWMRTIALAEAPDAALAASFVFLHPDAIENGNELELAPHELTPTQYANAQRDMMNAERDAGFVGDIIMGGVYALTDSTKQAITLALSVCGTCIVGVHLYDPSQADVDWLNGLDADVAVTETGSPTGCGTAKWQEQADYVAGVRALVAGVRRLKYFIVYQRPSAPTCDNLATFGTQAPDGTWKPLDALLAQWVKR